MTNTTVVVLNEIIEELEREPVDKRLLSQLMWGEDPFLRKTSQRNIGERFGELYYDLAMAQALPGWDDTPTDALTVGYPLMNTLYMLEFHPVIYGFTHEQAYSFPRKPRWEYMVDDATEEVNRSFWYILYVLAEVLDSSFVC